MERCRHLGRQSPAGGHQIISFATGSKCLPASRLSEREESENVNDSHAEILTRRDALLWLVF